jgi:S1-C subfamily serine protease
MRRVALLLAAVALLAGCGGGDDGGGDRGGAAATTSETPTPTPQDTRASREEVVDDLDGAGGFSAAGIYRREGPGVVTIISVFGDAGLEDLLGGGGDDGASGLGSGFVINRDGEIVTNAHVVTQEGAGDLQEARQVYVSFSDGNRVEADIRGYDPNSDIALLKVDPDGLDLRPLPLGADEEVSVGEPVVAIGSPFGADQSVSVGIVSAVNRSVESLTDFRIAGAVQTDAAINPGNSGGPLLDASGRVIGVNQQIQTRSGGNEGVGFAVPIDLVKRAVDDLREDGRASYAYLGVSTTEVYPQLAEEFDLPVERGAWVQQVPSGGPADEAGLRAGTGEEQTFQAQEYLPGGDVIVRVDGEPVEDPDDVAAAIALLEPGDRVEVEVRRGDAERTVEVRLGERPTEVDPSSGG